MPNLIVTHAELQTMPEYHYLYEECDLTQELNKELFHATHVPWTYMLYDPNTDLIKIGSSMIPFYRVAALSQEYESVLEIIGMVRDNVESAMQRMFLPYRSLKYMKGHRPTKSAGTEWFESNESLIAFAKKVFIEGNQNFMMSELFKPTEENLKMREFYERHTQKINWGNVDIMNLESFCLGLPD